MDIPNQILFHTDDSLKEMNRITPDGFFVRGVPVPQGVEEARIVYEAFKEWLEKAKQKQSD